MTKRARKEDETPAVDELIAPTSDEARETQKWKSHQCRNDLAHAVQTQHALEYFLAKLVRTDRQKHAWVTQDPPSDFAELAAKVEEDLRMLLKHFEDRADIYDSIYGLEADDATKKA